MSSPSESDAAAAGALPLSRLLSAGMEYADAVALHTSAAAGDSWRETAQLLGDANVERARKAESKGYVQTAISWFLYGSACYRAAQAAFDDGDPDRVPLYNKMVMSFASAGALSDPAFEYSHIPYRGGEVRVWKILPASAQHPHSVIVVGGLDGWREEHEFAARALVDRGVAVVLMEAPGQGETRLLDAVHMHVGFEQAFSSVIDSLRDDARLSERVGLWGNSFGGNLVAHAAIADSRVAAVCVNGGSARPAEVLEHFPQMISKVQGLFGKPNVAEARGALDGLTLTESDLAGLSAPLLVLHGARDQIFHIDQAKVLFAQAGSTDKDFRVWDDGEHCIYNHPHERNVTIADWFVEKLSSD